MERRRRGPLTEQNENYLKYPVDQSTINTGYTKSFGVLLKENKGRTRFFLYLAHSCPIFHYMLSLKFKGKVLEGYMAMSIGRIDWSMGRIS